MKRSYETALRCKFDGTAVSTDEGVLGHLKSYHRTQVPALALTDVAYAKSFYQTKEEYKKSQDEKKKANQVLKPLNIDKLYNDTVHFYMDKKGYNQEDANRFAQSVVNREIAKRFPKAPSGGGLLA